MKGLSQRPRAVITGLGVMSPAGNSFDGFWRVITSGSSALRPISNFNASGYPVTLAGEVDASCFAANEVPTELEKVDRALLLARCAVRRALADSGVSPAADPENNIALIVGTGAGPTQAAEDAYLSFAAKGFRGLRPRVVPTTMFSSISAHIGIEFGIHGLQTSISCACASANMALARALDLIRLGRARQVIAGGAEMPICPSVTGTWAAMRVLSTSTDPQQACLPFDRRRRGLVLAEGAAFFMVESLDSAEQRGAKIYAEILGYGESNDASHMTQPSSRYQARALHAALQDSDSMPEQISYVNAHGTGTDLNDFTESEALKICFGDHAKRLFISSTKSVIGHALGASGALELIAVLGALTHQAAPPTANLTEADPRCDLHYVPCQPIETPVERAISNSFAFGGANSVLVLGRFS